MSQTECAELPDLKERVKGEVGEYRERFIDFTIAQGIELEFRESIASALGMSYGGKIAILPGQAPTEEFNTLVHVVAHELLHKAERRTATTNTVRETEAEAEAISVRLVAPSSVFVPAQVPPLEKARLNSMTK